jgi:DNA-binding NtrC family response regulator
LNVFPVTILPLKQRRDDIPASVEHFIKINAQEFNLKRLPNVSPQAMERLQSYDWPGNVRELENAVEREVIRSMVGNQFSCLPFEEFSLYHPDKSYPNNESNLSQNLDFDKYARQNIIRVIHMTKGRLSGENGAVAALNIHPKTLRSRMIKWTSLLSGKNKEFLSILKPFPSKTPFLCIVIIFIWVL